MDDIVIDVSSTNLCKSNNILIFKTKSVKPSKAYITFWQFASERQNIFYSRISKLSPPWTKDPILTRHKFTNCYRASDRVSQYLIKNVIYKGDQSSPEIFFRTILFKFFNKIETWELLTQKLGEVTFRDYKFETYEAILTQAIESGTRLYSAAYIMPTGGASSPFKRKHQMHLCLLEQMMKDELPEKIANASSMECAFQLLRAYKSIGDFLAYQYVIDLNYSTLTCFDEMEFVVPGPGARDGIRKCFSDIGGLTEADLIRFVAENQKMELERYGIIFKSLWGRDLQLIDCQNLFCEVDKYCRVKHPDIQGVTGRTRIKQLFNPTFRQIKYWYPPKWGINGQIESGTLP